MLRRWWGRRRRRRIPRGDIDNVNLILTLTIATHVSHQHCVSLAQLKGFQTQRESWPSGLPLSHLSCLSALYRAGVFRSSSARRPQVPANPKYFTALGLGNCRPVVCSSIFSSLFCGLKHLLTMSMHQNIYASSVSHHGIN